MADWPTRISLRVNGHKTKVLSLAWKNSFDLVPPPVMKTLLSEKSVAEWPERATFSGAAVGVNEPSAALNSSAVPSASPPAIRTLPVERRVAVWPERAVAKSKPC